MDISKALNRLGETAIMREDVGDYGSDDIGAAFQKFSVVTKELSNLMKNLVTSRSILKSSSHNACISDMQSFARALPLLERSIS